MDVRPDMDKKTFTFIHPIYIMILLYYHTFLREILE